MTHCVSAADPLPSERKPCYLALANQSLIKGPHTIANQIPNNIHPVPFQANGNRTMVQILAPFLLLFVLSETCVSLSYTAKRDARTVNATLYALTGKVHNLANAAACFNGSLEQAIVSF